MRKCKCGKKKEGDANSRWKTRDVMWFGRTPSPPYVHGGPSPRQSLHQDSLSPLITVLCSPPRPRQVKAKRYHVTKTRPPPPSLSVTTECSSPSSELLHQEWGLRSPYKCRAAPHQVGGSSGDHQDACRSKASRYKEVLSRTSLYKL